MNNLGFLKADGQPLRLKPKKHKKTANSAEDDAVFVVVFFPYDLMMVLFNDDLDVDILLIWDSGVVLMMLLRLGVED